MVDRVFIGFDPSHPEAFAVARESVRKIWTGPIHGIWRRPLEAAGLYTRPTTCPSGQLFDVISQAPMATEFAIARFFVPHLCGYKGFALFMDCDMFFSKEDMCLSELFWDALRDTNKSIWCVKHPQAGEPASPGDFVKMDGKMQTFYARKNWSSFMLFNCEHIGCKEMFSLRNLNSLPGRDLHAFCGLNEADIGALDPGWNWLVGVQPKPEKLYNYHWTLGGPWLPEFADAPGAELWHKAYLDWIDGEAYGLDIGRLSRAEPLTA